MRLFEGTPWDQPPCCERCGKLDKECQCPPAPPPKIPPERQTAKLAVERRAKGKLVTVVRGLPAVGNDLPGLLSQLKSTCGAGGSLQEDVLEIQGDHRERIRAALSQMGFRVQG